MQKTRLKQLVFSLTHFNLSLITDEASVWWAKEVCPKPPHLSFDRQFVIYLLNKGLPIIKRQNWYLKDKLFPKNYGHSRKYVWRKELRNGLKRVDYKNLHFFWKSCSEIHGLEYLWKYFFKSKMTLKYFESRGLTDK